MNSGQLGVKVWPCSVGLHGPLDLAGLAPLAEPGPCADHMLMPDRPTIDRVGMAKSMGVAARRAAYLCGLTRELPRGLARSGPYLIEVAR